MNNQYNYTNPQQKKQQKQQNINYQLESNNTKQQILNYVPPLNQQPNSGNMNPNSQGNTNSTYYQPELSVQQMNQLVQTTQKKQVSQMNNSIRNQSKYVQPVNSMTSQSVNNKMGTYGANQVMNYQQTKQNQKKQNQKQQNQSSGDGLVVSSF